MVDGLGVWYANNETIVKALMSSKPANLEVKTVFREYSPSVRRYKFLKGLDLPNRLAESL